MIEVIADSKKLIILQMREIEMCVKRQCSDEQVLCKCIDGVAVTSDAFCRGGQA